jgi:hypothetical protein
LAERTSTFDVDSPVRASLGLEARLRCINKVDVESEWLTYEINAQAFALARAMNGKLLMLTNASDLMPQAVVAQ